MWRKFTERARKAVFYAQEVANFLGQVYVGPEHLLLGLLREADNVAVRLLQSAGADVDKLRTAVLQRAARSEGASGKDKQLTPGSKRAVDLAYEASKELVNNYIGTEHLLLGILREGESMAAQVLVEQGVSADRVFAAICALQDGEGVEARRPTTRSQASPSVREDENTALNRVVTGFIQLALAQGAERMQWTFGDTIGVVMTSGDTDQPLTSLPGHKAPEIRRYFAEWARSSGAEEITSERPVRLAFSHLGRDYDLMLTLGDHGALSLSITPV